MYVHSYVTGFWRTDQNVTLSLFHFIAPANTVCIAGYFPEWAHTLGKFILGYCIIIKCKSLIVALVKFCKSVYYI